MNATRLLTMRQYPIVNLNFKKTRWRVDSGLFLFFCHRFLSFLFFSHSSSLITYQWQHKSLWDTAAAAAAVDRCWCIGRRDYILLIIRCTQSAGRDYAWPLSIVLYNCAMRLQVDRQQQRCWSRVAILLHRLNCTTAVRTMSAAAERMMGRETQCTNASGIIVNHLIDNNIWSAHNFLFHSNLNTVAGFILLFPILLFQLNNFFFFFVSFVPDVRWLLFLDCDFATRDSDGGDGDSSAQEQSDKFHTLARRY